jgi:hypothetical protein
MGNLKQFSTEMQRLTIYSDEQVLSEMAYAQNLGVTTNELKQATMAAAGLAAKYRLDLSTAMMLVGRAHEGQTAMMSRYGIILDDTMTAQEKYNKIIQIGLDNFRLAAEQANSASGSWKQIKNELGEVAEALGQIFVTLAKSEKPGAVSALGWLAQSIKDQNEKAKEACYDLGMTIRIYKGLLAETGKWMAGGFEGNIFQKHRDVYTREGEDRGDISEALEAERRALAENQRMKVLLAAKQAAIPIEGVTAAAPKPLSLADQKKETETILKLYQDMFNGMKSSGGDYYSFSKESETAYFNAFKVNCNLQRQEYEKTIKDKNLLDKWQLSQMEQFNKRNEESQRQVSSQRAQITASMYEQMQNFGDDYFQAQKALLDIQYQDYSKFIKDKTLLDQWYNNQLTKISQDTSFVWQQFKGVVGETKGALAEFFMTFENGEDVLRSFGTAMQRMFANIAAEIAMYQVLMAMGMNPGSMGVQNPIGGSGGGGASGGGMGLLGQFAQGMSGGITSWLQGIFTAPPVAFGGSSAGISPTMDLSTYVNPTTGMGFHHGGIVGTNSGIPRPGLGDFYNAIRLHEGTQRLAPDEYRAILQSGEKVQSRAEVNSEKYARNAPAQKQDVNIRQIIVKNEDEIPEAMNSAKGEKVIITRLRNAGII